MCLTTGKPRTPPCRYCPRHFACSHLEPKHVICFETVLPHPSPSDMHKARLKQRKREWLKGHGTKLDWMKYKAESGWSEYPATHTPIGDPSLDAGFSSLSIKTSLQSTIHCESSLVERRFFLIATCRQLDSTTAVPAFRGSVFALDVLRHHT
jgi:hypothetical protein